MTLGEAILQSNIILPGHKDDFIKCLKDFPFGLEKWLYRKIADSDSQSYQGDILHNFPICFIDEDGDAAGEERHIALISNSCDMVAGRKPFIIVSPIMTVEEYTESQAGVKPEKIENTVKDLKNNQIFAYFYLPKAGSLPESFIDLSKMYSIDSRYLIRERKRSTNKYIISLSDKGSYLFLIKLTYHFARLEKSIKKEVRIT